MLFIGLLILSIAGAWWTYRDATSRGMRAQGWALFMVLTSCLGLPVYLMVRKRRAT